MAANSIYHSIIHHEFPLEIKEEAGLRLLVIGPWTIKTGRTVSLCNGGCSHVSNTLKPKVGLIEGLLFDLEEVSFELELGVGLHVTIVLAIVIAHDIDVGENIHLREDRVVVFTFC